MKMEKNKDTRSDNNSLDVQSKWNTTIGGNVKATGSGLVSTAPDHSQIVLSNGHLLVRHPNGATKWSLEEELESMRSMIHQLQSTVAALQAQLSEKENE